MSATLYETLKEKAKDDVSKATQAVRDVYDAFIEVGFSEEQAFDLSKTAMIIICENEMRNDF